MDQSHFEQSLEIVYREFTLTDALRAGVFGQSTSKCEMTQIPDIQQLYDLLPVGLKSFLFLGLTPNSVSTLGLSKVDEVLLNEVPYAID